MQREMFVALTGGRGSLVSVTLTPSLALALALALPLPLTLTLTITITSTRCDAGHVTKPSRTQPLLFSLPSPSLVPVAMRGMLPSRHELNSYSFLYHYHH